MKSAFTKQWVNITLTDGNGYFKAFIEKVGTEAGQEAYFIKYPDGTKEILFVASVFRIWKPKKPHLKLVKA